MSGGKAWNFEIEQTSIGEQFSVYNQDGTRITETYISESSARLIAAAPDLLAALDELVNTIADFLGEERGASLVRYRALITKARGE